MMLLKLASKSLIQRRVSILLTVTMVAISVFVLLSIETIRYQVKDTFSNTVSGIDLIVGARTGQLNLLLYSVFHIGNASNNITWQSYQDVKASPDIAWTIPLSLGDSHKGYRVLGSNSALFSHFKYGQKKSLELAQGQQYSQLYDVVLGVDVAKKLAYKLGDQIILSHGIAKNNFSKHDDNPFTISGIFKSTGTPIDKTVFVSLQAIEAIHKNWKHGVKLHDANINYQLTELTPKAITAFMVGLKSKLATFELQRHINTYPEEPLTAVLPSATLVELWSVVGNMEQVLLLISVLVLLGALLGMSNMLLVSMNERQYELAILRVVGASPLLILLLIQIEAMLIVITGIVLAISLLCLSIQLFSDYLNSEYGLFISMNGFNNEILLDLAWILLASFIVTLIPAITAYRRSLFMSLR